MNTTNWIIICLIALTIVIIYKLLASSNCNCNEEEHMINIKPVLNPQWSRNACDYSINNTLQTVMDKYNIKKTNDSNFDIMMPCLYDEITHEITNMKTDNDTNKKYFIVADADQLIAKDLLWKHLVAHYGINKAMSIMPMSYILYHQNDVNRFSQEHDTNKIYIMKKNIQRQEGLKITNSKSEILEGYNNGYVIAQELLQDPYTITDNLKGKTNNRKINMRFYALVICQENDITAYVHKNGFMYYTKESFEKGSLRDEPNITTGYIDREVYDVNPLTHDDFRTYLDNPNRQLIKAEKNIREQGLKLSNVVFTRINDVIKETFTAIIGKICNGGKLKKYITFQLFGFDIALNDELLPMVMEVNKGPDLGSKDKRDGEVKVKVVADIFRTIKVINDNESSDFIKVLEIDNGKIIDKCNQ
jgi:hypothetical protein